MMASYPMTTLEKKPTGFHPMEVKVTVFKSVAFP